MEYNDEIESLGFKSQNGLYFYNENNWKNRFSKRIEEVIRQKLKPYAIYDFNGEPFILFFDKPQSKEVHKWCWNLNSTPLVIIREENQLKIYNGLSIDQKGKFLELLQDNERKRNDFCYTNLVSGAFLEKYGEKYDEKTRVDYKLLENIGTSRDILINRHKDVIFNRETVENDGFAGIKVQTLYSLNNPEAYYIFECKRLELTKSKPYGI